MKQQTLPTSIEYGFMLADKVKKAKIDFADYFKFRADFDLKITQQPHLSNFIPCVEENGVWKPIEEPNKNDTKYQTEFHLEDYFDSMAYEIDCDQYQTALRKVLFSGWTIKEVSNNFIYIVNQQKYNYLVFFKEGGKLTNGMIFNDLTTLRIPLTKTGAIEFNLKF